jgi:hypothetical protein
MHKKAQLDMLKGLILSLVVIGVVIALAFLMMGQIGSTSCTLAGGTTNASAYGACYSAGAPLTSSYAVNGTNSVITAMNGIPAWLPLIVVAVIGVIVFGLIGMFYKNR